MCSYILFLGYFDIFRQYFGFLCFKIKPEDLRGSKFGFCDHTLSKENKLLQMVEVWSRQPNFDHPLLKNCKNISDLKTQFLMLWVRNMNVLPCLQHLKSVPKPHKIVRKINAKLKKWSKFGLLRYLKTGNTENHKNIHKKLFKGTVW